MKYHPLLVPSLGLFSLLLTPAARAADNDVAALAATIDARIDAAWGKEIKPAPKTDDAEFFRRIHLDLAGRIPSVTEVRDFLDDDRPDKRRLWVERILQGEASDSSYRSAYVNHFTNVWRGWLLAQTNQQNQFQQPDLEAWLRSRLQRNLGYDQLVRELLAQPATGNLGGGGVDGSTNAFFQANENKPENLAGSVSRLFLGVKLECAQCHNHPFDKWTRTQFWQFAAFFTDLTPPGRPAQPIRMRGSLKIPGQEKVVQARFLDGTKPKWKDPTRTRPTLVEWMTSAENPYFAPAIVNRLWGYFFGIGLVNPPEGTVEDTPASHKELLDDLARQFIAHDYDLKYLIRAIVASQAYQRSSAGSHRGQPPPRLFERMPLRGLSPEQLFDSLAVAAEYGDEFGAASQRGRFLAKFVAQERKTDYQTSILQALYLMNNEFIAERINPRNNRTLATLAEQRTGTARKIESLYLVALSRKPHSGESERLVEYIDKGGAAGDPKQALADVFWVLLNSPEFLLNH